MVDRAVHSVDEPARDPGGDRRRVVGPTTRRVVAALAVLAATLTLPVASSVHVEAADFPGPNGITVSLNPYPLEVRTGPGSPGFTLAVSDSNPDGVGFDNYYLGRVPAGWEVRVGASPIGAFASNPDGTSVFALPRAAVAAGQVSVLPPVGYHGNAPLTISRSAPDSPNAIVQFDGGTFDFLGDATPRLDDGPGGGDTDHDYKNPTRMNDQGHYPPNDGQYTIWVTSRISAPDDPYGAFGWADLRSVDHALSGYGDLCDEPADERVDEGDAEDAGKLLIFNASDSQSTPNRFVEFDVELQAGRTYDFSAYLANVSPPGGILPNVLFDITPPGSSPSPLVASGDLSRPGDCEDARWQRFGAVFHAPTSGVYELGLTNFAPGGGGNDLAIDNLSLREMTTVDFVASVTAPAELSVTKTVNDSTPDFGGNVTFTITATNSGVGEAIGAEVVDVLPAGLTYVSHTGPGTYAPATGRWTIPSIAGGGGFQQLSITARVATASAVTNRVSRVSAPSDPTPCTANCASATVTPQLANLGVTKAVSNASPPYGTNVSFTITVANTGTAGASGVTVVDPLPPGLGYVSHAGPGTYNPATGTWSGFAVGAGSSAALTLTALVQSATAVTNRVTSVASPQDPTPCSANCAAVTVTPRLASLTATKTATNAAPVIGTTVDFEIDVDNVGGAEATAVEVVDRLPAGLEFVAKVAGPGNYDSATGLWSGFTIPAGGSATLTLRARAVTGAGVTNTVTALRSPQDPTPCAAACASATIDPRTAEITVTKEVDDPAPVFGDTVTFTITARNVGDADATGVTATDVLPDGLELVDHTASAGTYDPTSGRWSGFALAASGGSETLELTARVVDPQDVTNEVTGVGAEEDPTTCETGCGAATVQPRTADIVVVKTVDQPSPAYSHDVTFTITATNEGDADATGVSVLDQLPPGLVYADHAGDGAYDATTGRWDIGSLPVGSSATLALTAAVRTTEATDSTITAVLAAEDPEPCLTGCTLTASVAPRAADLVVSKVADVADPVYSRTVTFTVEASNDGDADATGLAITDLLPAGLEHVGDDSEGAYDPLTGVWSIPLLASGDTVALGITARVATPDPVTNEITAVAVPEDPAPCADGCDLDEPLVPRHADLTATIAASESRPTFGREVELVVGVTNGGDADATAVAVDVLLPAGLRHVTDDGAGAYDASTGTWSVGDLAEMGGAAELVITAEIVDAADTEINVTGATAPEDPAPCTEGCASVLLDPRRAEVHATLEVDDAAPTFGTNVTFTVTVTNHGDAPATEVSATDLLPAGLVHVSDSGPGTYDRRSGVWTIGSLGATCEALDDPEPDGDEPSTPPACSGPVTVASARALAAAPGAIDADPDAADAAPTATLTITAAVRTVEPVTNVVGAVTAAEDPTPCTADCAAVTVEARSADLVATKTADRSEATVGDVISYTIVVRNEGDAAATDVVVIDRLPSGLQYVGDDSAGAFHATTGEWRVGSLAAGTSRTLRLDARVTATGAVTNTIRLTGGTEDPTPCGTACATAEVRGVAADVELPATGGDAHRIVVLAVLAVLLGLILVRHSRPVRS